MNQQELIEALEGYELELEGIIGRFKKDLHTQLWINPGDESRLNQIILETADIFRDCIADGEAHLQQLAFYAREGTNNFYQTPSRSSVASIKTLVASVLTRVRRNPLAVRAVALAAVAAGKKDPAFIVQVAERLPDVIKQLRNRYDDRPTLDVANEYDLQDLVRSLLALHFDDVRPEEWTPSYAGGSARMDFYLPEVEAAVEMKMTRDGLADKKIGDQLLIDIARYQNRDDCKSLYCIIYDPEQRIRNPRGLEADIEKQMRAITVRVMIVPRQ